MAQAPAFKSYGGLKVEVGRSYSALDLPTGQVIDTIRIAEAPLIWSPIYDSENKKRTVEGVTQRKSRNERGVRILIVNSAITYTEPNVPILYKEGEEIVLDDNDTYTFLNECFIEYGKV